MKVWVAKARFECESEDQMIGLYTSRRKAKRAVLDYFGAERGKWNPPPDGTTFEALDSEWLDARGDDGATGSVAQWTVR